MDILKISHRTEKRKKNRHINIFAHHTLYYVCLCYLITVRLVLCQPIKVKSRAGRGSVIIITESSKNKDPLKELNSELNELYCVHNGTQGCSILYVQKGHHSVLDRGRTVAATD